MPPAIPMALRLEGETESQLNLPRVTVGSTDLTEIRVTQSCVGIGIVRSVRHIERINLELQILAFTQREGLGQ